LFYLYAHSKDKKLQKKSLEQIKNLLKEKIRSFGWDMSDNVRKSDKRWASTSGFLRNIIKSHFG